MSLRASVDAFLAKVDETEMAIHSSHLAPMRQAETETDLENAVTQFLSKVDEGWAIHRSHIDPIRNALQDSLGLTAQETPTGPSYSIGQKFLFKVGDPVIANGYRATVIKAHAGQLAGMVDARVPGGPVCISSSYPDCYPAISNGVEVVTEGRHIGTVKEVGQFVTLDAGRGKLVAIESQKFDKLPQVGDKSDITVTWNKAVVVEPKSNSKSNER